MNRLLRPGLICALVAAFVGASPAPAFACTQPPGGLPRYTVAQHVEAASIVVEGVVIGTSGEIIGLLGIGGVVGLIVGVLIGIVIGLFIGRWHE